MPTDCVSLGLRKQPGKDGLMEEADTRSGKPNLDCTSAGGDSSTMVERHPDKIRSLKCLEKGRNFLLLGGRGLSE